MQPVDPRFVAAPAQHPRLGALVRLEASSKIPGTIVTALGAVVCAGWLALAIAEAVAMLPEQPTTCLIAETMTFLLVGLLGLVFLLYGLRNRVQSMALHEGGFVYRRHGKTVEAAWSDVVAVYSRMWEWIGSPRSLLGRDLQGEFRIVLRGRERVKPLLIDHSLPHHVEVGEAISSRVTQLLWPHCERAMELGQPLAFGPVVLDRHGLTFAGRWLRWQDVGTIRWRTDLLAQGVFALRPANGWLDLGTVPSESVPNVPLLYVVLSRMGRLEASA